MLTPRKREISPSRCQRLRASAEAASAAPGFRKLLHSTQTTTARGACCRLATDWSLPGEPQVQKPRRNHDVFLEDLAGQQVGFQAGVNDGAGLGGSGAADEEDDRKVAESRALGERGSGEPAFRLAQQQVEFVAPTGGRRGRRRGGRYRWSSLLFLTQPQKSARPGQTKDRQAAAEHPQVGSAQAQHASEKPGHEKVAEQRHSRGHVGPGRVHWVVRVSTFLSPR